MLPLQKRTITQRTERDKRAVKGNTPVQKGSIFSTVTNTELTTEQIPSKNYWKKKKEKRECPMGSAEHPKRLFGKTTGKGRQVRILISPGVSCQVMK